MAQEADENKVDSTTEQPSKAVKYYGVTLATSYSDESSWKNTGDIGKLLSNIDHLNMFKSPHATMASYTPISQLSTSRQSELIDTLDNIVKETKLVENWKLPSIESITVGNDGVVRANLYYNECQLLETISSKAVSLCGFIPRRTKNSYHFTLGFMDQLNKLDFIKTCIDIETDDNKNAEIDQIQVLKRNDKFGVDKIKKVQEYFCGLQWNLVLSQRILIDEKQKNPIEWIHKWLGK